MKRAILGQHTSHTHFHLTLTAPSHPIRSRLLRLTSIVRSEGSREVRREVDYYNLDAIVAVGYRVNSFRRAFRIWATKTLREFIIKGFVMDDERLKQGE